MKKSAKVFAVLMVAVLSISSVSVYAAEETEDTIANERPAISENADASKAKPKFGAMRKSAAREGTELTEEEKTAKIESIKKSLDEKLAAGEITQEEYDAAVAKLESGDFKFVGKILKGKKGKTPEKTDSDKMHVRGKKEKTSELTEEEKTAKIESIKKSLDEKLAAGKITQEKYDAAVAKLESGDFKFAGKHGGSQKGGNRMMNKSSVEIAEKA